MLLFSLSYAHWSLFTDLCEWIVDCLNWRLLLRCDLNVPFKHQRENDNRHRISQFYVCPFEKISISCSVMFCRFILEFCIPKNLTSDNGKLCIAQYTALHRVHILVRYALQCTVQCNPNDCITIIIFFKKKKKTVQIINKTKKLEFYK